MFSQNSKETGKQPFIEPIDLSSAIASRSPTEKNPKKGSRVRKAGSAISTTSPIITSYAEQIRHERSLQEFEVSFLINVFVSLFWGTLIQRYMHNQNTLILAEKRREALQKIANDSEPKLVSLKNQIDYTIVMDKLFKDPLVKVTYDPTSGMQTLVEHLDKKIGEFDLQTFMAASQICNGDLQSHAVITKELLTHYSFELSNTVTLEGFETLYRDLKSMKSRCDAAIGHLPFILNYLKNHFSENSLSYLPVNSALACTFIMKVLLIAASRRLIASRISIAPDITPANAKALTEASKKRCVNLEKRVAMYQSLAQVFGFLYAVGFIFSTMTHRNSLDKDDAAGLIQTIALCFAINTFTSSMNEIYEFGRDTVKNSGTRIYNFVSEYNKTAVKTQTHTILNTIFRKNDETHQAWPVSIEQRLLNTKGNVFVINFISKHPSFPLLKRSELAAIVAKIFTKYNVPILKNDPEQLYLPENIKISDAIIKKIKQKIVNKAEQRHRVLLESKADAEACQKELNQILSLISPGKANIDRVKEGFVVFAHININKHYEDTINAAKIKELFPTAEIEAHNGKLIIKCSKPSNKSLKERKELLRKLDEKRLTLPKHNFIREKKSDEQLMRKRAASTSLLVVTQGEQKDHVISPRINPSEDSNKVCFWQFDKNKYYYENPPKTRADLRCKPVTKINDPKSGENNLYGVIDVEEEVEQLIIADRYYESFKSNLKHVADYLTPGVKQLSGKAVECENGTIIAYAQIRLKNGASLFSEKPLITPEGDLLYRFTHYQNKKKLLSEPRERRTKYTLPSELKGTLVCGDKDTNQNSIIYAEFPNHSPEHERYIEDIKKGEYTFCGSEGKEGFKNDSVHEGYYRFKTKPHPKQRWTLKPDGHVTVTTSNGDKKEIPKYVCISYDIKKNRNVKVK